MASTKAYPPNAFPPRFLHPPFPSQLLEYLSAGGDAPVQVSRGEQLPWSQGAQQPVQPRQGLGLGPGRPQEALSSNTTAGTAMPPALSNPHAVPLICLSVCLAVCLSVYVSACVYMCACT